MKNLSIINDLCAIELFHEPFPHVVIKDALEEDLANELTNTFPLDLFSFSRSNQRIDISASKAMNIGGINEIWQDFIKYHSSLSFYHDVLGVFKKSFKKEIFQELSNFSTGVRGVDVHKSNNILLDAQISVNSPVKESSSVRNAHVDNTNKLFSGLFYLRQKDDDSIGGDLELCRWRKSYTKKEKIKFYKEGINKSHFEVFKKIPYKNNTAVLFLNSLDAIHLVTERKPTEHPRCFVNLVGETGYDLFSKHKPLINQVLKLKMRLKRIFQNK